MSQCQLIAVVLVAALACALAIDVEHGKERVRLSSRSVFHKSGALPVVMWHGFRQSCCDTKTQPGNLKQIIEDELGVFVYSIATGKGPFLDILSSFKGDVNSQVAAVCKELKGIPELAEGFDAIGFSQGSQFLRAVQERCGHEGPRMRVLVSLAGQHQGIMEPPSCGDDAASSGCLWMETMLKFGVYTPFVQNSVVQAQYYKDPLRMKEYLAQCIFLPDVNNDKKKKNALYKDNLASLEKLVLVLFEEDSVVIPRESAWFGISNGKSILPLEEQPIYKEDWLGLKELAEEGDLVFVSVPGDHLVFTDDWFLEDVVRKYLGAAKEDPPSSLVA
jgi:palmitoyl-protein thioesterase